MSNHQASGARDRFTKALMYDIRKKMSLRLSDLRQEQEELTEKLKEGYDNDTYRQLSIINHSIEVATVRKKGEWLHGNNLQSTAIAK